MLTMTSVRRGKSQPPSSSEAKKASADLQDRRLHASMVVIVASGPSAPCSRHMIESTLLGTKALSLSFSPWHEGQIGRPYRTRMNYENVPPSFGPECAALRWFDLRIGDPEPHLYPAGDGADIPLALDGPAITRHEFPPIQWGPAAPSGPEICAMARASGDQPPPTPPSRSGHSGAQRTNAHRRHRGRARKRNRPAE